VLFFFAVNIKTTSIRIVVLMFVALVQLYFTVG